MIIRTRVYADTSHPWRAARKAAGTCRSCPRPLGQWRHYCDRCQVRENRRQRTAYKRRKGKRRIDGRHSSRVWAIKARRQEKRVVQFFDTLAERLDRASRL